MTTTKNCTLNTCSTIVSSGCVEFTGDLIEDSYIDINDCSVTLNDYLTQVDTLLKKLIDNQNPSIIEVTAANCGFTEITDFLLNTDNLDGTNVLSKKLIITLLNIICAQKAELDAISTNIWDYELPDSILDNLKCLSGIINDPCDGPIKIKTLKDLLLQIIIKICP